MDHQYETTHCGSYVHVTDDVMLPQTVEAVTPKCLRLNISATVQDTALVSMDHLSLSLYLLIR